MLEKQYLILFLPYKKLYTLLCLKNQLKIMQDFKGLVYSMEQCVNS